MPCHRHTKCQSQSFPIFVGTVLSEVFETAHVSEMTLVGRDTAEMRLYLAVASICRVSCFCMRSGINEFKENGQHSFCVILLYRPAFLALR